MSEQIDFEQLGPSQEWQEPHFYDYLPVEKVREMVENREVWSVSDRAELALKELYEIENPDQKDDINLEQYQAFIDEKGPEYGTWVYFPWNGNLVRFPEKKDHQSLRTSRNRNLITQQEQDKLFESTILVAGMSVGSNVAETMAYQGTGGKLILADMDKLEPTNLNRIRAPYSEVGNHKVDIMGKKISELDPYIEQVHYKDGINEENFLEIIEEHNPDVIVDEVDSLPVKIMMRMHAIREQIPVVMATDDGEDVLIDIERYDKDKSPKILHGLLPDDVIERVMRGIEIPRAELGMIIGKHFVGFENVPIRMLESLAEVGKSIPSWPQLGTSATLAGVVATYCAKEVILDHNLQTGRAVLGPDTTLNPEMGTEQYEQRKQQLLGKMMTKDNS